MAKLFQKLNIKGITLKNRIVMSPMCQYSAKDGYTNDWHMVHLGSRAAGGTGLIISEATAISPEGRITPGDVGIWKNDHISGLRRIADFIHAHGAVAGIQLAHAGRKASCAVPWEGGKQLHEEQGGWLTLAPSSLPFNADDRIPQSLDETGIRSIILKFKDAARRALEAGFKVAEIHSAHGYLLFEFLSPLTNQRTDQYGGSFENRTRLLLQVTDAVRSVWPDENPLFVRVSSTDWSEGGWTVEETVKLAVLLKGHGVDLIDCSSGGNLPTAQIPFSAGYQVQFSEAVRKTGILTGAVGLITSARQAEAILQEDKADLILFGREMLRNPYFALQAAQELSVETNWPVQYLRAKQFV
ncbi:MAG: NADH:flavin oxidoreductase/NADH oxidase [Bacteroidales bacterium]|nr:NADH:flavin oxidoreductase/NADH oxidase [Bacteroidales bacterium]